MNTVSSRSERRGFTLIEILAVIAIILILVGMLLPAVSALQKTAKRTRAQSEVAVILHAFKQYYNEYQQWPTNLGPSNSESEPGIEVRSNVVAMLSGLDIGNNNPRLAAFLNVPPESLSSDGAFKDPWGNAYRYMCDFDCDGTTHVETAMEVTNLSDTAVAVWSTTNRVNRTLRDSIVSWR